MQEFRINRSELKDCHWAARTEAELQSGQVRFALETFGLSANNITYADLGEKMAYWQFFPTEAGFGLLPVWGMARVVESSIDEMPVGTRAYGYWPLAERWLLEPRLLSQTNFIDQSAHRAELPSVYQFYQIWPADFDANLPQHIKMQARYALLRPLYLTSWLCADFLRDAEFFGAESIWILSASSKTALALGDALARMAPGVTTVGFSSPANVEFAKAARCYHFVHSYDAIEQQSKQRAVVVDIAGDPALLSRVYQHLADQLKHTATVGISHRGERTPKAPLPGIKPQFFFAPTQAKKRSAQFGGRWIEQQSSIDWEAFLLKSEQWMQVHMQTGFAAAQAGYLQLLAGQVRPMQGLGFTL